jgi:hypothetical protein
MNRRFPFLFNAASIKAATSTTYAIQAEKRKPKRRFIAALQNRPPQWPSTTPV